MSECAAYLKSLSQASELDSEILDKLTELLLRVWKRQGTVWLCGNGGSATTAAHFASDLSKSALIPGLPMLRAVSLTERMASLTAFANDDCYENVFSSQLSLFLSPTDVLICFSCSGNSPNIINAVITGKSRGSPVVLFTGHSGGKLASQEGIHLMIKVPSPDLCVQEDLHLAMCHAVARALALKIAEQKGWALEG